jgi:hypothetical protein
VHVRGDFSDRIIMCRSIGDLRLFRAGTNEIKVVTLVSEPKDFFVAKRREIVDENE